MLVSRSLAHAVIGQRLAGNAELRANEDQHRLRDDLARLDEPTRISQRAQLKSEAEPILWTTPTPDMSEIGVVQNTMAEGGLLGVRQAEQDGTLPGGENGTTGHGYIFRTKEMFVVL